MYTSPEIVKKIVAVTCLCFALVASSASAAVSVPALKPLSSTQAWFRVGDYSLYLKGLPSASPEYLATARFRVKTLRHRLNNTVQRRHRHRRHRVNRQARSIRRELVRDARANAHAQRRKAQDHYRERRREAQKIPDVQRRKAKLRHAKRLLTRRKLEIERSLLRNLRQAGNAARHARRGARPRLHHLHAVDRGAAKVQNRELSYQFRALRNRS
jgi:hypothetical protein